MNAACFYSLRGLIIIINTENKEFFSFVWVFNVPLKVCFRKTYHNIYIYLFYTAYIIIYFRQMSTSTMLYV